MSNHIHIWAEFDTGGDLGANNNEEILELDGNYEINEKVVEFIVNRLDIDEDELELDVNYGWDWY